ncbi:MAG: flavodoxin family protein [Clostridia bacterium]|nr:flavodoxin family protein [Clostridia bacterium]
MRVLAFSGSPRARGNTRTLVDEVIRGASNSGAACEVVDICSLNIAPCRACGSCSGTGHCVQKDDMEKLYSSILESDAFVFGTPVYFWGPSAQMKAFIDRWYAIANSDGARKLQGKKAAVVTAYGDTDPETPEHVIGMFRKALDYLKIDLVGTLGVTASDPGDARANSDAMHEAYGLGQGLCE